ncbi:MAG: sigma factor-like helix-turn-helix DNA-binding protein [Patescibacteria group bacterium]
MTQGEATKLDAIAAFQMKDAHFTKFARDLISHLKEKQQKVLMKRFGLSGRKRVTLDAIGREFGVTRERVRQIEAASITKLKKIAKLEHNQGTFDRIVKILEAHGGAMTEESFVNSLIYDLDDKRMDEMKKMIGFILLLSEDVHEIPENDHTRAGFALKKYHPTMVADLARAYTEILESRREVMGDEILMQEILTHKVHAKYVKDITPQLLQSVIGLSRLIHTHDDGKKGLVTWPWVKPRTIRDKIFYVLSKSGEPMHFSDIATAIEQLPFDNKSVTVQTVHNELISDNRFVLVGRGLYGLSHWGFEPGTVEDVIAKIMESHGTPLDQNTLVEEVLKKKKVKKATILINLQSSKKFKKTKEGYIFA